MPGFFLAMWCSPAEKEHCGFVKDGKGGEIAGMGTCGTVDELELRAEAMTR